LSILACAIEKGDERIITLLSEMEMLVKSRSAEFQNFFKEEKAAKKKIEEPKRIDE